MDNHYNEKLEGTWVTEKNPYANESYEQIREYLEVGMWRALFVHPEMALASLIAAGWRDKKLTQVVIVFKGRLRSRFQGVLMEVLNFMKMSHELVKSTEQEIWLTHDRKCRFILPTNKDFRGLTFTSMFFCNVPERVGLDLIVESGLYTCICEMEIKIEIYFLDVLFDEDYERRQELKFHEGSWNATLKLRSLENVLELIAKNKEEKNKNKEENE